MRTVFASILFASTCLAASPPPVVNLESPPETVVAGCVSVISGDFIDSPVDLHVPALEPLFFQRLYIRSDCQWPTLWSGWEHNFMRGLCAFHKHKWLGIGPRIREVLFRDEIGSAVHLRGDTDSSKTLHFKISQDAKGITNAGRGIISGRNNLANMEITFENDFKSAYLTTGGGIKRYFLKRWFDGQSRTYFDEKYEERASGYRLTYTHVNEGQAVQWVSLTAPNTGREVGWLKIQTPFNPTNECQSEVAASNGEWLKATFSPKENAFLITRVESSCGPPVTYSYNDKSLRLFERRHPDERFLQVKYYEKGANEVCGQAEPFMIKSGHWMHGRVRELIQPAGPNGEPVPTYRFHYRRADGDDRHERLDDTTDVYDALGHLKRYQYTNEDRPTTIIHYLGSVSTGFKAGAREEFLWGPSYLNQQIYLKSRFATDSRWNWALKRKAYKYDERGNVLVETTTGNFTGFDENLENVFDKHEIVRTYTTALNLIESETFPSGLTTRFTYLLGTDLVASKLTYEGGHIVRRLFNRYDGENILVETVEDDGQGESVEDLTGVNQRSITRFTPKLEAPCYGFPQEIKELALDLQIGCEVLLNRRVNRYNHQGKLVLQEVYGSDDLLAYTLAWDYDNFGHCRMETTIDGCVIIRRFDASGNCVEETGPHPQQVKRFTYNQMNRLTLEEEAIPSGVRKTFHRYDAAGNRISTTNPCHQTIYFRYDEFNRLTETVMPKWKMIKAASWHL